MTFGIFLLDTNIVSETQLRKPHPKIMKWLEDNWPVAIPYPVLLEVKWSIANRYRKDPVKADALQKWFDWVLETDYEYPAMTIGVALLQAQMMEVPRLKNLWIAQSPKKPPGQDLRIAAIAIEHGMPIATFNTKDFVQINEYFPLPGVLNPVSEVWAVPRCNAPRPSLCTADEQLPPPAAF